MQTDVHVVTDRAPLREPVRIDPGRDRRRGGTPAFARAMDEELPAPRAEHSRDELVPARRAPDADGEAGTRIDLLA